MSGAQSARAANLRAGRERQALGVRLAMPAAEPTGGTPAAHSHVIVDVALLGASLDALAAGIASKASVSHGHGDATPSAAGFMPAADKAKLNGIAANATANASDASLRDRSTHTGSQSLDTTSDSATRLAMTAAERTKLGGVAPSATANATDAALRDRSTHTGSQSLDTTTDSATRLAMTAAERTKLGGVAVSATANATDAALRDRSTHTGSQSLDTTSDSATRLAMTAAERTKLGAIASAATANSSDAALSAFYRTLLDSSGSHTAARVAGTYGLGQSQPLAISGTGVLYPLNIIYLDPADYPAIGALTAKLRLRCALMCNDVPPTGNYTIGLHPVTRPATSGGAGLAIYTIGAAVAGSTVTQNAPAADAAVNLVGADFALPAAGFYCIGVVTTAAVAASAHVHLSAALQLRYA